MAATAAVAVDAVAVAVAVLVVVAGWFTWTSMPCCRFRQKPSAMLKHLAFRT